MGRTVVQGQPRQKLGDFISTNKNLGVVVCVIPAIGVGERSI
jgi:hypothetical protein